ncbi:MAG: ZIP family metal transporter [Candidatus Competibacteraceae bacterium]|jgi:zinc transporter ZupT|nr:ZIP family metal transporter [Candidatus Competibacteraceae bacterium]
MTKLELIAFVLILGAAVLGGIYPLTHSDEAKKNAEFPHGEAFTAGVFLALSLLIMLPAGFHLFGKAFPSVAFPYAPIVAIVAFLMLLAIEHVAEHAKARAGGATLSPPVIPLIMTVMITIPSFLLGTALGISEAESAFFILIAILAHKGSAGFGLAIYMVRSTMTRRQSVLLYSVFAFATPLGIIAGVDAREMLSGDVALSVKAFALAFASGVFLYLATLHEFCNAPFIRHCVTARGFAVMLIGLLVTIGVRVVLGLGHAG